MRAIIAVPTLLLIVYRAYTRKSLTPGGIAATVLTAIAHAVHPWYLPFALVVVFYLAGTRATHVKEHVKAQLTLPASGASGGGEGPRTHNQVFANSLVASVLSVLHAYQLHQRRQALLAAASGEAVPAPAGSLCFSWGPSSDLLVIGLIANYAVVAADTFSSELGILSPETPRLITSWTLRKVPRGTNGGVTLGGLAAGLLGSMMVVTTAMLFLPLCTDATTNPHRFGAAAAAPAAAWTLGERRLLMAGLTVWGLLGSVLDSVLGGLFQRSVRDVRSGKIVEGAGGLRVLLTEDPHEHMHPPPTEAAVAAAAAEADAAKHDDTPAADGGRYDVRNKKRRPSFGNNLPSRVVENGWDLLNNNDVNFLTALTMSLGAMGVAGWYWGASWDGLLRP